MTTNCWICGADADSAEHLVKASDLRALFGQVSQKRPLYLSTDHRRNQPVGGIKSDRLKYHRLLCARCNNQHTQPHDRAWEHLSAYLRRRQPTIRTETKIWLHKVFPGAVHSSMLGVHLYFAKLFGCLIVQHAIPIDISEFSASILCNRPHPKLWLGFWVNKSFPGKNAGQTQVETAQLNGRVVYATWFYFVGPVAINVIYAETTERRKGLVHAWRPDSSRRYIQFAYEA